MSWLQEKQISPEIKNRINAMGREETEPLLSSLLATDLCFSQFSLFANAYIIHIGVIQNTKKTNFSRNEK